MFDCANDVLAYHDSEVTLRQSDRTKMKDRRDANRTRLNNGLQKNSDPLPKEYVSQGSYRMKTMVQYEEKDYDIDDGVYFDKADLVGPNGGNKTALETRKMIRDAVDDGCFKTAPTIKPNCVRVHYDAGYHVDLPAYRKVTTKDIFDREVVHYELASSSWIRSDARDVTNWFDGQNKQQSPDSTNGRQLRRIVRFIKKYSKSRKSWANQVLSGFGITILVTECYVKNEDREDKSLHDTMIAIRDRLKYNLVVDHPVTPDSTITTGDDDPKAKFLRERLTDAIGWLEPLFEQDCDRKKALKCWDKVFDTKFFMNRYEESTEESSSSAERAADMNSIVIETPIITRAHEKPVQKKGGGRYG